MSAEQLPLVAIMMPSMNHERFVVEAVESVFAQGYPNLRVVICDDASTDSNYAKLQELASRFPIVLLKNEVRQGIVKTLNRCYAQCSDADYFYGLATDDVLQPGMIRACLAEIARWPEAGMLLGAHVNIDAEGRVMSEARVNGAARRITLDSPFERYYPSFQFHRGAFTRSAYPLPTDMLGEDMYLFTFGVLSRFEVVQTDIAFILRRLHGNNTSLSQAYVTVTDNEWCCFPDSADKRRKMRVSYQRHMLCCLGLPNASKERFIPVFREVGWSWHYFAFRLSFLPPVRWGFSFVRWLIRSLR